MDYVLVGAFAVAVHGVVRATTDVDLIPNPDPENLARLAEAIAALDGSPSGEPGTPVTAELLAREANMRFETAAGQLDVLLGVPYRHRFPALRSSAVTVELEEAKVVVASRNDLIRLKAGTGRDRDVIDIGDLLALDEPD